MSYENCSNWWVENSFSQFKADLINVVMSVQYLKIILECLLQQGDISIIDIVPSYHEILNIVPLMNEPGRLVFSSRLLVADLEVIVLSRKRIDSTFIHPLDAFLFLHLKHDDQSRLYVQGFEQLNLSFGLGESIHNEAIYSALRFRYTLTEQPY